MSIYVYFIRKSHNRTCDSSLEARILPWKVLWDVFLSGWGLLFVHYLMLDSSSISETVKVVSVIDPRHISEETWVWPARATLEDLHFCQWNLLKIAQTTNVQTNLSQAKLFLAFYYPFILTSVLVDPKGRSSETLARRVIFVFEHIGHDQFVSSPNSFLRHSVWQQCSHLKNDKRIK